MINYIILALLVTIVVMIYYIFDRIDEIMRSTFRRENEKIIIPVDFLDDLFTGKKPIVEEKIIGWNSRPIVLQDSVKTFTKKSEVDNVIENFEVWMKAKHGYNKLEEK